MAVRGLIGKKVGMTQVFDEDGRVVPVTVLECGPCPITQIKTEETDGYRAVQIGYGNDRKPKRTPKAHMGHVTRAGAGPQRVLREFRVQETDGLELGQMVTVDAFEGVGAVKVTGYTKGRGFTGLMKRYDFGGGRETHGSHHHRRAGTIGMCATPSRTHRGQKMAGRYGNQRRTVKNLQVMRVDTENNLILVKGAVPGAKNGYVLVQATGA
ncbi:MAG TPA: 50S ribosomal protein L3 [Candidatus Krumholzibacteria bacterium]|nr:50S ribosomal protein L3 [Candidatus Krumholzibacteria bacterium]